jgi:hypothetical protein
MLFGVITMAHGVMVITTIIMVTSKITVSLVTTLMSSGSHGPLLLPQKALALNDTANSAIVNIFFILLLRMTIKQF